MDDADEGRGPRGIQSIEVGGQLLLALAHHGRPMPLKDLAREAGMAPAKAHPYLVSFGKLGLVEQEPGSGRYGLGPLALQLGLISLQQYDPVRLATPLADELAQSTGHTVALAVWGNRGPTIVRVAEAPSPVHVAMRHGTVMSVRGTASGWLFAAFHPRAEVAPLLAEEAPAPGFEAQLDEVRRRGLARAVDLSLPGVSALAAPVFDGRGAVVLSITAIGPSATFDSDWDGPLATELKRVADGLSRRLGWQPG
ncbi:IclR family transcriptional regulator [Aquincola sp. J276]|uniref:IclR family transcriptional regulator n=1 Tax=Aquincola sp. J276 TaxID=2898432 RepID=UPI002151F631|nr:IclR family transcriptional regulator [Aquincola sp. J276]MCR5863906.1 IclR family transcriptional regulator [Aquincola sp. J276]